MERKTLMNINSVAEKLVSRCLESLPGNETPTEDIKADTSAIAHTVEAIQDRWQNWSLRKTSDFSTSFSRRSWNHSLRKYYVYAKSNYGILFCNLIACKTASMCSPALSGGTVERTIIDITNRRWPKKMLMKFCYANLHVEAERFLRLNSSFFNSRVRFHCLLI